MAKDLPYFKFFCSEWNDGDVTLESYKAQGLFINICSYYWSNECNVHFDKLLKKFRGYDEIIGDLNAAGLFKIVEGGFISITFLDEQREEREETSKKNSDAGKLSAKRRALKKLEEQKANELLTETQRALDLRSTETQPLREEERREDKKREENIKPPKKDILFKVDVDKETIFNEWLNYREEIKKPIKVTSTFNTLVTRFNKEPLEKCKQTVNASIENNYQGLFWDKYKSANDKDFLPEIPYPNKIEFMQYAKSQLLDDIYQKSKKKLEWKWNAWNTDEWKDGNGKQISNWKSKLLHNLNYITQ